jgi:CHAD domain-containing protein
LASQVFNVLLTGTIVSFELHPDKSLRKSIRKVAGKQLELAHTSLSDSKHESETERVHAARKNFKRLRAVVRLVRFGIGTSAYQTENEEFRDAGRPLSEIRDAKVLIEALSKLKKQTSNSKKSVAFREARKHLIEHQRQVHNHVIQRQHVIPNTAAAVEAALARMDDWTDQKFRWGDVQKGIRKVYRDGRKMFDRVKADPTVENLHEWRKQAKYLRYHLELLTPTWPQVVGKLATEAKKLSNYLGDDHDLAVLRSMIVPGPARRQRENGGFIGELIDRQREKLQAKAISAGELLYREGPKEFVRRLTAYWRHRNN